MTTQQYVRTRAMVAVFVASLVSVGVTLDSPILAGAAVLTGMIFLLAVKSKTKIVVDEREKAIREKAANMTYAIFTPTIGLGSFFLILFGQQKTPYIFALGQVLAYLTLFLITVYSLSLHFLNRRYSGKNNEK